MSPAHFVGALAVTENLLKRRWSVIILRHISNGINTPPDICEKEPDLTAVVMNERLRTMQRYSLITRSPARATAKSMNYRLTPRGQKILKMLTLIEQFDQLEDIVFQTTTTGGLAIFARLAASAQPPDTTEPAEASRTRPEQA